MTTQKETAADPRYSSYLDHGFVGLVEHMGSDESIDESARMSYGKGTRTITDRRNLIRYLVRHQHTSPIEMGEVRFHLKVPIFVMRQLVRHRTASLNEYSGRYSEMTDEMYIPETTRIQTQSLTNKQGSGEAFDEGLAKSVQMLIDVSQEDSYGAYEELIAAGLARELARCVLPVSNYTELYWKIDLKNFFHLAKLRLDPHAQWEIVSLAQLMYDAVKPLFPITCEAFEDYWLNARSYSAFDRELVKQLVACVDDVTFNLITTSFKEKMSKREFDEFIKEVGREQN